MHQTEIIEGRSVLDSETCDWGAAVMMCVGIVEDTFISTRFNPLSAPPTLRFNGILAGAFAPKGRQACC